MRATSFSEEFFIQSACISLANQKLIFLGVNERSFTSVLLSFIAAAEIIRQGFI